MYQFSKGKLPKAFNLFFLPTRNKHSYGTRFATRSTLYLHKARTNFDKYNTRFLGPNIWNEMDGSISL